MSYKNSAIPSNTTDRPRNLAIGIDMGGTSVKMGVCDGSKVILKGRKLETQNYSTAKDLISDIVTEAKHLMALSPGVSTVGMGVPGFTDFSTGLVYNLTNVDGWEHLPLNEILSESLGVPCFAENDANCMAYAEFSHGAGRGARNMIGVTLGTGVGGGLVIEGRLFRGSFSGAGEIGQMSIDYHGRPGYYGNTGSLEQYIGNGEIQARAEELYKASGRSLPGYSPKLLSEAASKGDPLALKIWDAYASELAGCLASCIYLLNPDTLVIGGGVADAGDILMVPLRAKLTAQLAEPFVKNLRIVLAEFGNTAGIIGSAAVALDRRLALA